MATDVAVILAGFGFFQGKLEIDALGREGFAACDLKAPHGEPLGQLMTG
ncbi:MAG: hypothetical protein PHF70_11020 [Opitutales bacterium]|nr:hypothetical protein [Opitutales bacterium]